MNKGIWVDRDRELSGTFACGRQQVLYGVQGAHKLVRTPLLKRELKEFVQSPGPLV